MGPIKKILAIVDPTMSLQPCVAKAARLALATGATLELFICDFESDLRPSRFAAPEVYETALAQRQAELDAKLETLAEPLRKQGLRVLTDVAFEEPLHFGIIDKVRSMSPDIVFKDTHYHGPIRRALFTNTDWHLIRECPAPLMLTKPAVWRALVKLTAALDPGHVDDKPATLDRELLVSTQSLASALRGEVSAVHVFNSLPVLASMAPIGVTTGSAVYGDAAFLNTLRAQHERDFQAVLALYPAFVGHADLLDGPPAAVLADYVCDKEIDIMVMGAIARGALQRLLVGSTAERLLDRLPCDVLIVKPERLLKEMAALRNVA